jgi:hypothetical protein
MAKNHSDIPDDLRRGSLENLAHWVQRQSHVVCPTCGTEINSYWYVLRDGWITLLARIAAESDPGEWVDIPAWNISAMHSREWSSESVLRAGGVWCILRHFGLVEPMVNDDAKRTIRKGVWRITDLGRMFLAGDARVPWKVQIRKKKKIDQSDDDMVTAAEALVRSIALKRGKSRHGRVER